MPSYPEVERLETVLVVDDNEMVRTFVVSALEGANFNVISADSGPNALRLSEGTKGRIDLLLTDWDMPEMSGIELGEVGLVKTHESPADLLRMLVPRMAAGYRFHLTSELVDIVDRCYLHRAVWAS